MNFIWGIMLVGGIAYAAGTGRIDLITTSAIQAAENAVGLVFNLLGVMCLWLGIMKLAEQAGCISALARLLCPLTRLIFRSVPPDHPAMGAIIMTLSANLLGLGNAATPFGLKAMQELQTLNYQKDTASPAMCTFLALCTTGFTLVPATVIALRTAAGSVNPTEIVGVTWLVSFSATVFVIMVDFLCRNLYFANLRR